jgi:hypothetical protein
MMHHEGDVAMIDIIGNRHEGAARGRRIGITAVAGVALFAVLSAPTFAESFIGRWIATAEAPGGGISETLTVAATDDGYAITAKLVDPTPGIPEAGPGIEIVIDGDSFSYKRTVGDIEIVYVGVVSGDSFSGTADMGGIQVPYTGVRMVDVNRH